MSVLPPTRPHPARRTTVAPGTHNARSGAVTRAHPSVPSLAAAENSCLCQRGLRALGHWAVLKLGCPITDCATRERASRVITAGRLLLTHPFHTRRSETPDSRVQRGSPRHRGRFFDEHPHCALATHREPGTKVPACTRRRSAAFAHMISRNHRRAPLGQSVRSGCHVEIGDPVPCTGHGVVAAATGPHGAWRNWPMGFPGAVGNERGLAVAR
jgi:hypothetical protein